MKVKILATVFLIFVGISMIGVWAMLYFSNNIPELETEPIRISMHITAEMVTAIFLIIGGIGLFKDWKWGFKIYLISMGMLLYTLIQSPGYYAQQGVFEFVVMFFIFIIITILFIIFSLVKPQEFETSNERGHMSKNDLLP